MRSGCIWYTGHSPQQLSVVFPQPVWCVLMCWDLLQPLWVSFLPAWAVLVTHGHKGTVRMASAQHCWCWQSSTQQLLQHLHLQTALWKSAPHAAISTHHPGQLSRPETMQGEKELPSKEVETRGTWQGGQGRQKRDKKKIQRPLTEIHV